MATRAQQTQAPEVQAVDLIEQQAVAQAKEIGSQIDSAVIFIRTSHEKIASTVIEIGHRFYQVKTVLDAVLPDTRRVADIPRFSMWMNTVAPERCGMSKRSAWSYLAAYSEALATGLNEKTVIALAPSLLKTEKSRAAVIQMLSKKPEIVTHLNETAKNPKELKKFAASEEVQAVLKVLEPRESVSRADRISKTIVSAYSRDMKDPDTVNDALEELTAVVNGAANTLGVGDNFAVSFTPRTVAETPPGVDLPLPQTQQEAIDNLSKLIQSGAAKVVAVGR